MLGTTVTATYVTVLIYQFQCFQLPAFTADGFNKLEVKDQQTTGSMTKQQGVYANSH